MRQILAKLLGGEKTSKDEAKQRLKFLLIHDQVDLAPGQLDAMREELVAVVARYMDVDAADVDVRLQREDSGKVALVSSMPVRRVTTRAAS